ncbi:hypothetical protein IMG5_116760 [Ichthyophthirius multifiliis]|uniref:Protein kinase domain-containing protein n=1 Tax=Ichthyophthirius multifiliis TaxID=5932 RepID=G0QUF0_ICHMU|nr:hypothetical protein IMG5_116760 [Ichthyophthirius multifiliis]EGR31146.1 hypothetical protein IMG5_116760 [Ichthyophthirius multifiliis]|eukprot:XP_004034632.1 hypothetical protein IMG5_116760 [Ichthyophthirius multifiliis]
MQKIDVVKIADFGYSTVCGKKDSKKTYCGTLDYMSPEIVKGEKYNKQVDMWAFGVLAYEILQGVTPFYERSRKGTLQKIEKGQFNFTKDISDDAKNFVSCLLNVSSVNRQSIKQQIKHQWINQKNMAYQQKIVYDIDLKVINILMNKED